MKNKGDIALISKWGKNICENFRGIKMIVRINSFLKKIDKEEYEGD